MTPEWLETNSLEQSAPKRGTPIKSYRVDTFLRDEEYTRVVRFCNQHDDMACRVVRTILGTGLRVSEAANLKAPADIEFNGIIHVRNGKGSKSRQVMASPELQPFLAMWLHEFLGTNGYLFHNSNGSQMNRDQLGYMWKKVLRDAGVTRCLSIHKGRHTYASWMHALRRLDLHEIQAQLGHESYEMTVEFYDHALIETMHKREKDPAWEPEWLKESRNGRPVRQL